MNPWLAIPNLKPGKFRVGDCVRFLLGRPHQTGVIEEDRGNIGVGGRRLYGVAIREDEWNTTRTIYSEEDMELVERPAETNGN
jgi:hypothetical protein